MQETRILSADRQVRLSSGDIEILPKDYDSILFLSPARRGGYLISCFSLMSNVQRRLKNVEFGKLVSSGIRHPSLSNLLLLDSCFLILVTCLPAAGRILPTSSPYQEASFCPMPLWHRPFYSFASSVCACPQTASSNC
jgi:hypothetical protein